MNKSRWERLAEAPGDGAHGSPRCRDTISRPARVALHALTQISVLKYLALGSGLAFAAVVQPGPFQAFLVARVAATGWRRTLPACFAPVLSDIPIAIVAVLVLGALPLGVQQFLRAAGGVLLLYLAWTTVREARDPAAAHVDHSVPRTMAQAVAVNLLNPNPYLAWAFVLGPALVSAWREHASYALAFLVAFYGTMVPMQIGFVLAVGTAHFLGDRGRHTLVIASAIILAALALYLLGEAGSYLIYSRLARTG